MNYLTCDLTNTASLLEDFIDRRFYYEEKISYKILSPSPEFKHAICKVMGLIYLLFTKSSIVELIY